MRSEENPLDLNNLPDDYSKDGKQDLEDTSSSYSGYRKKKSGGKDECGKVYECRFCSLKFCKSQALGGHMNRHRQERETETLNRARQLVFTNDSILGQAPTHHHIGGHQFPHGGYHPTSNINMNGDPFRTLYTPRMFSGSSPTSLHPVPPPPPPQPPYMYSSPPRLIPYPSQYPVNDYIIGHALPAGTTPPTGTATTAQQESNNNNYTCIGAPIGQPFPHPNARTSTEIGVGIGVGGGGSGDNMSMYNHEQEMNRGKSCLTGTQQRMGPSWINRFQDGF